MNHDFTHEQITNEFDALWEVVTHLEDAAKDQLKQIEDLRRGLQDLRYRHIEGLKGLKRLTQLNTNEGAHIAQETDI